MVIDADTLALLESILSHYQTTQQPKEKFGKAKELATVLRNKLGSV
jgi:hypothetical protein